MVSELGTEALVIEKEVGLAAENSFGDEWPANRAAKAAVMEAGKPDVPTRSEVILVILPGIR